MTKQNLIQLAAAKYPSLSKREITFLYDDLLLSGMSALAVETLWMTKVDELYRGVPLQYVSTVAHFYNDVFYVDEAVLIPRPETEELVYTILQDCKKQDLSAPRILDIGTGSGCIPISLKKVLPYSQADAIDISAEAVAVAKKNAHHHKVDLNLIHIDFREKQTWTSLSTYDVIVSNPPYIPRKEKVLMHENVLAHEPHVALFVDDSDPLLFYRLVAEFGLTHLAPGGSVYLELNEYNAQQVAQLYSTYGYATVRILSDLQGKDRMCVARLGYHR